MHPLVRRIYSYIIQIYYMSLQKSVITYYRRIAYCYMLMIIIALGVFIMKKDFSQFFTRENDKILWIYIEFHAFFGIFSGDFQTEK